ncbi:sigma-54 interaction domain-containing protein [Shouchella shacheensis]|uniref:sigma-54 interaction domain-containing protein n=1 Tax=Shouchella shacheensis TaxID=1649580 RepID=UPI00073FB3C7|nr:sigma-54-dependent Fis family transcriptional regulator [Shouchella shacheensis]
MKRVALIGSGNEALSLVRVLAVTNILDVVFVITEDHTLQEEVASLAIPWGTEEDPPSFPAVEGVIQVGEEPFSHAEWSQAIWFDAREAWAYITEHLASSSGVFNETALHAIHDGIITVDAFARVVFANEAAGIMADFDPKQSYGLKINDLLQASGLPRVIQTKEAEYNQMQTFANGTTIVTTRVPLFMKGICVGAIAIFKDVTEATRLAEEVTDLKSIQTMLEAIINSSNDAISVVDEHGVGLMINPAYTKMTGLPPERVIGQPATADISEGESIHMKVLETKKPVRGARLKLGAQARDVIVNVAPVIVDGQLKGSVGVIHDVSELSLLSKQLKEAKLRIQTLETKYSFEEIVGDSKRMREAIEHAKMAASTSLPILLLGETGTGKELFAHAIHNESERRGKPFIRVNCAALSETLLESELFGYEPGAFSGAKRGGKRGLFEEADKGSLFLDELGELSPAMQAKLLRVLQEQEIVKVGGARAISIDVRLIAATNANLQASIAQKTFREDLYFRVSKLPISIPPLRERISDLKALVYHLLQKLNYDYGHNIQTVLPLALAQLGAYHWPGNVRELENVLARTMIYMDAGATAMNEADILMPLLSSKETSVSERREAGDERPEKLNEYLAEKEKEHLASVLQKAGGVKTEAAKRLGISVRSLYYKLERYQLE